MVREGVVRWKELVLEETVDRRGVMAAVVVAFAMAISVGVLRSPTTGRQMASSM
jgi:hypothetical protein